MEKSSKELVKRLYTDGDGDPIILSLSQEILFNFILKKDKSRIQIITPTQFGKSLVVALAVLTRICLFSEKWVIVAPSAAKASIIMGYIIEHSFDNEFTKSKLKLDPAENLDRLRRERSKERLTFTVGKEEEKRISEVFILSADSKNKKEAGNALMGWGSANIVLDEAALIDDDINAKVMRMLGGHSTKQTFLMKIGNPFKRNHFLRTHKSERFYKMHVTWQQAVDEGRFSQEYIDEMKEEPLFDVLYEGKFPTGNEVDEQGWAFLLTDADIDRAIVEEDTAVGLDKLGCDVADSGRDSSCIVYRNDNYAKILFESYVINTMTFCGHIIKSMKDLKVAPDQISVDKTGIGVGLCQRLRELGYKIYQFIAAGKAYKYDQFRNRRAEIAWEARKWILGGGKLIKDKRWEELNNIKYRIDDSSGKIQIMSKDLMSRDGLKSPNIFDAFALTFSRKNAYNEVELQNYKFQRMIQRNKTAKKSGKEGYNLKVSGY